MNRFILLVLFSYLIISCKKSSYEHPNFDELPMESEVAYSLDLESKDTVSVYKFLEIDYRKYFSSIVKDTSDVDLFGVQNLKIDTAGNIYFSRTGFNSIFVHDKNGFFTYAIGAEGRGPGEFNNLISFDFDDNFSRLIALDQTEIEVFSNQKGIFQFDFNIPLKVFNPKDLCVMGDTIFYTGFKYEEQDSLETAGKPYNNRILTSGPIHAYDLEQEKELHSFGPLYRSYSKWWLLDAQLSDIRLACNETTNTIVGLLHNFGYFYGYKANGGLKWISKLENFKYATLIEQHINTPQIRYSASPGGRFSPFRNTNSGFTVFQLANNVPYPHEIILNTANGELTHAGSALPEMFGAKLKKYILTIHLDVNSADGDAQIKVFNIEK